MKRHHHMPFGAELNGRGTVRFQLWAPGASTVRLDLTLGRGPMQILMPATGEGWFTLALDAIPTGTPYSFRIDDRIDVPDPASRYNPRDVHAPSVVIDPHGFEWPDQDWRGRPWEEAAIYELHIGAFTPQGTFDSAIERLDYLVNLGVTAIEIMPVADFPGRRNWGYDGVLQFAPDASYGSPDDLKVRSCMTLFSELPGADLVFTQVLEKYYEGKKDEKTIQLLRYAQRQDFIFRRL